MECYIIATPTNDNTGIPAPFNFQDHQQIAKLFNNYHLHLVDETDITIRRCDFLASIPKYKNMGATSILYACPSFDMPLFYTQESAEKGRYDEYRDMEGAGEPIFVSKDILDFNKQKFVDVYRMPFFIMPEYTTEMEDEQYSIKKVVASTNKWMNNKKIHTISSNIISYYKQHRKLEYININLK